MIKIKADVIIVCIYVHGSSFHKIFKLQEMLAEKKIKCVVIVNVDYPCGLQRDIKWSDEVQKKTDGQEIIFTGIGNIDRILEKSEVKVALFDSTEINKCEMRGWIEGLKSKKTTTCQYNFICGDFCYNGADYLFLQHPIVLWSSCERTFSKKGEPMTSVKELSGAKKIYWAGNIYYEPVCNIWTSDIRTKLDFYKKYRIKEELPLYLWLPDRVDGKKQWYDQLLKYFEHRGYQLLVKLHPHEYRNAEHGFDDRYGHKNTSASSRNVKVVDEMDGSWAYQFSDAVLIQSSGVAMEMALWQKPVILLKSNERNMLPWVENIVREISIPANSLGELDKIIEKRKYLSIKKRAYENTKKKIFYETKADSLMGHVNAIERLLSGKDHACKIGSEEEIRRLYKNFNNKLLSAEGGIKKWFKSLIDL